MHSAPTISLPAYQLYTSGERECTVDSLGTESGAHTMSAGMVKGSLLGTKSPSEVFQVIESKERGEVAA